MTKAQDAAPRTLSVITRNGKTFTLMFRDPLHADDQKAWGDLARYRCSNTGDEPNGSTPIKAEVSEGENGETIVTLTFADDVENKRLWF